MLESNRHGITGLNPPGIPRACLTEVRFPGLARARGSNGNRGLCLCLNSEDVANTYCWHAVNNCINFNFVTDFL